MDNRGSHFYLGLYWAQESRVRRSTPSWPPRSRRSRSSSQDAEAEIVAELNGVQGEAVDLGGYYHPDEAKVAAVMRPSATLNAVIDAL
ncbi:MAG: NADP-dependent isocitrate dehydrogenase [Microbacterium sp.]